MADDLIQPSIPEGGGGKTPPKEQSADKCPDTKHDDAGTTSGDKGSKTESFLWSALAFATFECFGVYFWQIADGSIGISIVIFHWISLCCLVAGIFAAAHQIIDDQKRRLRIWFWFIFPCIFNVLVAVLVWGSKNPTLASMNGSINETNNVGWLPPELPPNCTNVTVWFGTQRQDYPIWMAKIQHAESETNLAGTNYFEEKISSNLVIRVYRAGNTNELSTNGTHFAVKDLPEFFLVDGKKMPDYSPRNRHITMSSQSTKGVIGDKILDFPVWPFVSNNRLFVDVEIPFINERHRILMDTNGDNALSDMPKLWDINYNSTNFEVVNEDANPVLQVIYKSANEVQVNGIYLIKFDVYEAFNSPPNLISPIMVLGSLQTTQQIGIKLEDFQKSVTNIVFGVNTNGIFRISFPNQKAIFKYPSAEYLGELAK
jgi:hypothetical protein